MKIYRLNRIWVVLSVLALSGMSVVNCQSENEYAGVPCLGALQSDDNNFLERIFYGDNDNRAGAPLECGAILLALQSGNSGNSGPSNACETDSYTYDRTIGTSGTGDDQFDAPGGITVDSDNNFYVADQANSRIKYYDNNLQFVSEITGFAIALHEPGLTPDGTSMYIPDLNDHKVKRYSTSSQAFESEIGTGASGPANGQFAAPYDAEVASNGDIYVADSGNDRIQIFDSSGSFKEILGSSGTGDGQFDTPYSLYFDADGNLYVADANNHRVQKFDSDGNFVSKFGSENCVGTPANNEFCTPRELVVDSEGNIFVADTENNRVLKFDPDFNFLTQIGTGTAGSGNDELHRPQGIGIVFDTGSASSTLQPGDLLLTDNNNDRIQVFKCNR